MQNHLNPFGASPELLKEQELENNLLKAEFAWNDAVTLEDKRKALELVNLALNEIENFKSKPSLQNFEANPSLIPTMMREMESRIQEKSFEKFSKECLDNYIHLNCVYPIDDVKWDNQSWEEQRG
jgi:hypothetical protein